MEDVQRRDIDAIPDVAVGFSSWNLVPTEDSSSAIYTRNFISDDKYYYFYFEPLYPIYKASYTFRVYDEYEFYAETTIPLN